MPNSLIIEIDEREVKTEVCRVVAERILPLVDGDNKRAVLDWIAQNSAASQNNAQR